MTEEFAFIELQLIVPSLTNPRKSFHQAKLQELTDSIKASGVHQPILLRPLPGSRVGETSHITRGGKALQRATHEIVCGERRYRASLMAQVATIPAMVKDLTDDQVREIQIVENLQRDDLTEQEEAEGYEQLMKHSGISAELVAEKIGKSRTYVYTRLKLLDLCTEAREALREGKLDASKASLIARIPDSKLQIKALQEACRKDHTGDPLHGYRSFHQHIQRDFMLKLGEAKFKITDASLVPKAGSCKECPKRTGANPDLFSDVKVPDTCTDPACFHSKEAAHSARIRSEALERGQTIIEGKEAKALLPSPYRSEIEGYKRLDTANDSPTDKPLRALLSKEMEQQGIQPVLVANPHKDGELVAVLPNETVTSLLKAKGLTKAAEQAEQIDTMHAKNEAYAKKQALKEKYERGWRMEVLHDAWRAIEASNLPPSGWPEMERYMAKRAVKAFDSNKQKEVAAFLKLDKVAPQEALLQHIQDSPAPIKLVLLTIMFNSRGYNAYYPSTDANEGLLLIAERYQVDVEACKARVRDEAKAKLREAKDKSAKKAASKTTSTPNPAALRVNDLGGAKGASRKTPAAPRAPKLSAQEATQGIAAAMQGLEQPASAPVGAVAQAEPPTDEAAQRADTLAELGITLAVGQTVTAAMGKLKGKTGQVLQHLGDDIYQVKFKGYGSSMSFRKDQLNVVADTAAA